MKKESRSILVILVTLAALGLGGCQTTYLKSAKSSSDDCCGGGKAGKSSAKKASYR